MTPQSSASVKNFWYPKSHAQGVQGLLPAAPSGHGTGPSKLALRADLGFPPSSSGSGRRKSSSSSKSEV